MSTLSKINIVFISLILTACINLPSAPTVMTLPGTGKSFNQFLADDQSCQQFAYTQIGGTPSKTSKINTINNTPSVNSNYYSPNNSSYVGQQYRYDMSYIQCMYAKGHRVPVSGQITSSKSTTDRNIIKKSTSGFTPPPPPKGTPPPPPPSSY